VSRDSRSQRATGSRSRWEWAGIFVLAFLLLAAWFGTINAAAMTLSFAPNSDQALQEATDARVPGLSWGLAVVAVALARFSGDRWWALLGVPGLVVAVVVLLPPPGNGSAFVLGLASSLLAVLVAAFWRTVCGSPFVTLPHRPIDMPGLRWTRCRARCCSAPHRGGGTVE
jgi:peptidoglycan/LPS O-acetylase OafA/YrhL